MSPEIRRGLASDAPRLSALASETFALACPPGTLEANIEEFCRLNLSEAAFKKYLSRQEVKIWVGHSSDNFLGYIMSVGGEPSDPVVLRHLNKPPAVEISKIYVREQIHGAGLAQLMMTQALDNARSERAKSVWLGVNKANQRARRFYKKMGFKNVGERKFRVGDDFEEDYVMEKLL